MKKWQLGALLSSHRGRCGCVAAAHPFSFPSVSAPTQAASSLACVLKQGVVSCILWELEITLQAPNDFLLLRGLCLPAKELFPVPFASFFPHRTLSEASLFFPQLCSFGLQKCYLASDGFVQVLFKARCTNRLS